MRHLRLLLVAFLLAPSTGCAWWRELTNKDKNPTPPAHGTGAIPKVSAEQLVGYLNTQAGRLNTITYGEATVSAKEGDGIRGAIKEMAYPTLRGTLSASQPRYFRMAVKGGVADVNVDIGSNPDQFWAYLKAPTMEPMYVFASHSDFESGKAKVPGNLPVDPDWILQALGMTTFSPNHQYTSTTDERNRTYTLSWPDTTPNGVSVRKEIVFAVDDADASRSQAQVKKHLVRDTKGTILCWAEIRSAKTIPASGSDPQTGRQYVVQYPTEVLLRWEQQKFEMTLKLDAARVNQPFTQQDTRRLFDMPNKPGSNPVNLAEARFGTQ